MAIKIDLLPGYVKWTKRFHFTIAAAIVGLALWTGGLILVYHSKQLELQTAETNANVATEIAVKSTAAETATTAAQTEAAGFNAANNFMLASCKTGSERAALLNLISKYIDRNSVVKTIDVSDGKTVSILATVSTPDEYAQFLLFLRNARGVLFSGDPKFTQTGVGGYGSGAQPLVPPRPAPGSPPVVVNYPISLTAQGALLNPIVLPNDPTGAGGGATTTGGSDPRAFGGSSGPSPSATSGGR